MSKNGRPRRYSGYQRDRSPVSEEADGKARRLHPGVDGGIPSTTLRTGLGQPQWEAQVSREEVAHLGGSTLSQVQALHHEGLAMEVVIRGAAKVVQELHRAGKLDGIISLGGSSCQTGPPQPSQEEDSLRYSPRLSNSRLRYLGSDSLIEIASWSPVNSSSVHLWRTCRSSLRTAL